MSNSAVQVTFGADASQLLASIEVAKAQLAQLQSQMRATAGEMVSTGNAADAGLRQKLGAVAGASMDVKGQLKELEKAFGSLGGAAAGGAHGAGAGFGFYAREAHYLLDELSSGNMRRFEGTLMNVTSTFLLAHAALVPWVAGLAALAAALGYVAYEAVLADEAMHQLPAAAAVGQFTQSREQALQLRDAFASLANVSNSTATEILAKWQEMGAGGSQLATTLVPYFQAIATAEGVDVSKAAEEMLKRFSDLKGEGLRYVQSLQGVTTAEIEHYKSLVAEGRQGDAWGVILQAMRQHLGTVADANVRITAETQGSTEAIREQAAAAEAGLTNLNDFGNSEDNVSQKTGVLKAQLDQAAAAAIRLGNSASTAGAQLRNLALSTADSLDSVGAQIRKLGDQEATLRAGMDAAVKGGDTAAIDRIGAALTKLDDKKKELAGQKSDPLGLDRNALKQDEDALKHYDDTFRGSDKARLSGHIAMLRQMLASEQTTTAERHQLQQDLESSEKQLYEATTKAGTKSASDILGAQRASIEGQIQAQEQLARDTISHLQAQVKLKQTTPTQANDGTIAALKKEEAAVDALYAKELALAGTTATKKQELLNKEVAFNDQVALKIQEAQVKAAEAAQKEWKRVGDQISGIINSQVDGVLKGTTSIGGAFRNMAASAVEDLIKLGIQITVDDTLLAVMKTFFGGLSIPGFAVGTPFMQQTGLAMIHQGEAIIPASLNPFASGGAAPAGGNISNVTHNWNITGGPSASPRDIANQVASLWNANPSMRPTY